jgi:membrane associated rhomboid family serine protease
LTTQIDHSSKAPPPPYGNYIVILMMVTIFAIQFLGDPNKLYLNALILKKPTLNALIGYSWLHLDLLHVLSNIVLLAVFGKAACTQLGAGKYFIVYIFIGIIAGIAHTLLDGRSAIGSSGAVCGIMGVAIVLSWQKLSPFGPWIILTWVAVSVVAAIDPTNPDASCAHITGFVTGMIVAILLAAAGHADTSDTDPALIRLFSS